MVASYYRIQQDLVDLMESVLDKDLSFEQAYELKVKRLEVILSKIPSTGMDDLWEIGEHFEHWLDDEDIRRKDREYHKLQTDRLRDWCEKNAYRNFLK